jgi:hypothetical protein
MDCLTWVGFGHLYIGESLESPTEDTAAPGHTSCLPASVSVSANHAKEFRRASAGSGAVVAELLEDGRPQSQQSIEHSYSYGTKP